MRHIYCLSFALSLLVIVLLIFLSIVYIQTTTPPPPAAGVPRDPEIEKLSTCAYPPLAVPEKIPDAGLICVVVRTTSEQLARGDYSVRRLITSLEQMEYKNWRAHFFSINQQSIQNITEIFAERSVDTEKYRLINLPSVTVADQDRGYTLTDMAI
jgi:hypothetical protein